MSEKKVELTEEDLNKISGGDDYYDNLQYRFTISCTCGRTVTLETNGERAKTCECKIKYSIKDGGLYVLRNNIPLNGRYYSVKSIN